MSDNPNAIQPYQRTKQLLRSEEVQQRFKEILGEKAPGFLASVLNTVYLSNYLRDADPNSVITSALIAAALDLPIDPNLGFSYLVPYRERGNKVARFQLGYKGYIQLALRSSQYQTINAAEIYEGERVTVDRLTGAVKLNGNRTGDSVIGYVAYFKLLNGFEKYVYMTVDEVKAHAARYSKSWGDDKSAWSTNFDGMARKTVLRQLLSRYGILSIQMQTAMQQDHEADGRPLDEMFAERANQDDGQVIEGEVIETDPPETDPHDANPPIPSIEDQIVQAGLSENAHAAANALKLAKLPEGATDDQRLEWMRVYRGWRDLGADSKQASASANKGEKPK